MHFRQHRRAIKKVTEAPTSNTAPTHAQHTNEPTNSPKASRIQIAPARVSQLCGIMASIATK